MSTPFDAEEHVRHMAEVMEIAVRAEWMPTVVANMAATGRIAELVLAFPLDDHVEPAPVFEA
jgi:hypothetical protein